MAGVALNCRPAAWFTFIDAWPDKRLPSSEWLSLWEGLKGQVSCRDRLRGDLPGVADVARNSNRGTSCRELRSSNFPLDKS